MRHCFGLVFVVSHEKQSDGWTPLHAASLDGHVDVLRALLDAGALVNQAEDVSAGGGALNCSARAV